MTEDIRFLCPKCSEYLIQTETTDTAIRCRVCKSEWVVTLGRERKSR
jgi:DNA-directed RNA polymerase subunit RPC12/RpoP